MKKRVPKSDISAHLTWPVVLGLKEPNVVGWSRVRAAQIVEMMRLLPVICLINVANAATLAAILWSAVPHWQILAWLAAILSVMGSVAGMAERIQARLRPGAAPSAIRHAGLATVILGILWAMPPTLFSSAGTLDQQLAICLVSTGMMACAILTASTLPIVTLIFITIVGAGTAAMMVKTGSQLLTALPLIYGLWLNIGAISSGHAFLRRKQAELELEERNEVISVLLKEFEQAGADWLWEIDSAKRLGQVSPRLARAANADVGALEGMSLVRLLAGDQWENGRQARELNELLDKLNAREAFSDLVVPMQIGGEQRWWRLSAAPRYDERGAFAGFRGVGSDVTEQRRSDDKIYRMARYDALTGLPNRLHLNETLSRTLARALADSRRCALMLIDLDRFKAVNDTLGHPIGDRLLVQVAARLRSLLGDQDLCGRLGGDEFAVVVGDIRSFDALDALGTKIIDILSAPYEVGEHILHIGASVGSAVGPRDGRTVETLIRNADLALYRAKDDGRGVHRRYEEKLHAEAERRRMIEFALRSAIDLGQFSLAYQPIVNTDDGNIQGFEALLRWHHPDLGNITPDVFIPIAEETRLIHAIGEWVLRTACAEAATWPAHIRLAVNLSAEQLSDAQLPNTVLSALSHSGLAPDRLELEVTEGAFLRRGESSFPILDSIQRLGVRIALEDFGTGYSGLGYLSGARFSTIKIDRSFVHGAATNSPESMAIIRAVVAMADSLGMATTAEGAETADEFNSIRALGCRRVQGYLSGRPMTAEEARILLAREDRSRNVA
ncbi:putative bifunctional diguanylate cyclase/phosphodiesterase [Flavisphingomonas formosensis]|uniref:putative bifunctional diguanylate cyclase/phosphodiesterase n=1 Tax=Flavisphingomonas formosensis TaxID=861534 RepID=UPI001E4E2F51|nr:EAL domain-containing protein [Sphingomonas formosensis]